MKITYIIAGDKSFWDGGLPFCKYIFEAYLGISVAYSTYSSHVWLFSFTKSLRCWKLWHTSVSFSRCLFFPFYRYISSFSSLPQGSTWRAAPCESRTVAGSSENCTFPASERWWWWWTLVRDKTREVAPRLGLYSSGLEGQCALNFWWCPAVLGPSLFFFFFFSSNLSCVLYTRWSRAFPGMKSQFFLSPRLCSHHVLFCVPL